MFTPQLFPNALLCLLNSVKSFAFCSYVLTASENDFYLQKKDFRKWKFFTGGFQTCREDKIEKVLIYRGGFCESYSVKTVGKISIDKTPSKTVKTKNTA